MSAKSVPAKKAPAKKPAKRSPRATQHQPAELNLQMDRFAQEYMKDMNATKAAIRAGYSEKAARQQGSRLLGYFVVQDRLQELHEQMQKAVAMDATSVVRELADEAKTDLADLYDDNNCLKPIREWPVIWRVGGLIAGIKTREIWEKDENDKPQHIGNVVEVKVSDKVRRKELIGKHLGAWREKKEEEKTGDPVAELWAEISGISFQPKDD
nr:MAG TPA: Terminase small subunit [Caudoviricetes sp.]